MISLSNVMNLQRKYSTKLMSTTQVANHSPPSLPIFIGFLDWDQFVQAMGAFAGKSLDKKIDVFIKVPNYIFFNLNSTKIANENGNGELEHD
jgi:hypothetical protein